MGRDRLVFAGSLTIDNIVTADRQMMPPSPGGNVVYSALGARLWHDNVGVVTVAGAGFPAEYLGRLEAAGIDLGGVRQLDAPHGMNVAFCYAADGTRVRRFPAEVLATIPEAERARFRDYGAYDPIQRFAIWHAFSPLGADIPAAWLQDMVGLHCAAMPVESHHSLLQAVRGWSGRRIWAQVDSPWYDERDLGLDHASRLMPELDALLPSEADLATADPRVGADWVVRRLRRAGARLIVIKRGALGSEIVWRDGRRSIVPALAGLDVIDPTGAGDAYCGGFLAGIAVTGDVIDAAHFGTVSASFAIEGRGVERLLAVTPAEARHRLAQLRGTTAHHFNPHEASA